MLTKRFRVELIELCDARHAVSEWVADRKRDGVTLLRCGHCGSAAERMVPICVLNVRVLRVLR